jgi:hypothetical protein
MKKIFLLLVFSLIGLAGFSQQYKEKAKLVFDTTKPVLTLDASCGICQFKMEGKDCALAVKYEGKYYYVEGTDIDDHGNAHDKHGFCNAVRKAKVQGELVGDKFRVTWFELVKEK